MKKALSIIAVLAAGILISSCGGSRSKGTADSIATAKADSIKNLPIIDTPQRMDVTEYFQGQGAEDSVETKKDSFSVSFARKDGSREQVWFHATDSWKSGSSAKGADSAIMTSGLKRLYAEIKASNANDFYLESRAGRLLRVVLIEKTVKGKDDAPGMLGSQRPVWVEGYSQVIRL
ncbi:MAG: hypothetical protein V4478_02720 [Patescibacteria group bacterium]